MKMAYETDYSVPDSGAEDALKHDLKKSLAPPPGGESNSNVEAPEGGTKAWLSLLGAFCAMFVSFGWMNCIALFQAEYETNQLKQYSESTVSWITSMEGKSSPGDRKHEC
jgi:hypothetical protein